LYAEAADIPNADKISPSKKSPAHYAGLFLCRKLGIAIDILKAMIPAWEAAEKHLVESSSERAKQYDIV